MKCNVSIVRAGRICQITVAPICAMPSRQKPTGASTTELRDIMMMMMAMLMIILIVILMGLYNNHQDLGRCEFP